MDRIQATEWIETIAYYTNRLQQSIKTNDYAAIHGQSIIVRDLAESLIEYSKNRQQNDLILLSKRMRGVVV